MGLAPIATLSNTRCVPRLVVPDNLKSGVSKACKYEPIKSDLPGIWQSIYGCAVLPARPRKPRDKAAVENGVLISKMILAVLRHRTFYSLAELNNAIRAVLGAYQYPFAAPGKESPQGSV